MIFKKTKKKETENIEKIDNTNKPKENKKTYDKEFEVEPLRLLVIIVNRYQVDFYINKLSEHGVAASFLCNGSGTATREIYNMLGVGEIKKDVIFSLVRKDKVQEVFEFIQDKFKVSNNAKGVAVTIPIDAISGVLLYRFFTDTKENITKKENNENGK